MNPDIGRRYKRLLIFVLILAVPIGGLLFFYRMYNGDIDSLKDFVAAYERFDRSVSDLDRGNAADIESQAGTAVNDLGAKASLRLSSLIKNDAELMDQALEVAALARKEVEGFSVHKSGIQSHNADLERLAEEARAITGKRKAAFDRFQELAGVH